MTRVRPSDSAHHMFGDSCGKRRNARAHECPRGVMTTLKQPGQIFGTGLLQAE